MQETAQAGVMGADGKPTVIDAASFDTTIVLCVEAGGLEQQAVLLVQSIRNWGGRFAKAPIVAVQPRLGPSVDKRTLTFFRRNQVEFVRRSSPLHATWRSSLNKSKALSYVERAAKTETVTWLDTDVFVVSEPDGLALSPDEDFAAMPCRDSYHSTTGPGHRNEAYWQTLCDLFGIDIETMGWLTVLPEQYQIRTYWQAGVFSYRRSFHLGHVHYEAFCRLLESRISHNTSGIFHYDQTSLTFAVHLAGLRSRALHFDHNLDVNPSDKPFSVPTERIAAAKVIHYHNFMWPNDYPRFLQELRPVRDEVRQMLEKHGPLDKQLVRFHRRVLISAFRRYINFRYKRFERSCRVV
jgi:hypothetical protein